MYVERLQYKKVKGHDSKAFYVDIISNQPRCKTVVKPVAH